MIANCHWLGCSLLLPQLTMLRLSQSWATSAGPLETFSLCTWEGPTITLIWAIEPCVVLASLVQSQIAFFKVSWEN
jgi:hypothetical protein